MSDPRRSPSPLLLGSLGELVRSCRLGMGLTQQEIARRVGVGLGAIQDVERGSRGTTIALLNEIVERGLELQLDVAFRRLLHVDGKTSGVAEIVDVILREAPHARARLIHVLRRELVEMRW